MRVQVYYNLRRKLFSVKALSGELKGRVIAHAPIVELDNCIFKVSQAGRKRVLATRQKNVHAGIEGNLVGFPSQERVVGKALEGNGFAFGIARYNPYKYETFVDESGDPVLSAQTAVLTKNYVLFRS